MPLNIDTDRLETNRLEGVFAENPAKHIFNQLDDQRKAAVVGVLTKKDRSPLAVATFRDFAAAVQKNSALRDNFATAYQADLDKKKASYEQLVKAYGPVPTEEQVAAAGGAVPTALRAARYFAAGAIEALPFSAMGPLHGAFAPPEGLIAESWRGSPHDPARVAFERKKVPLPMTPLGIFGNGPRLNVPVAGATTMAGNFAPAIIGGVAGLVRGGIGFATGRAAATAEESLLAGGFTWTDRLVGGGVAGNWAERLVLATRWGKAGEAAVLAGEGPAFLSSTVTPQFVGKAANLIGRAAQVSTSELGHNFPQTINDQFGEVVIPENFWGAMITDIGLAATMGLAFEGPGRILSAQRARRALKLKGALDQFADLHTDSLAGVGATTNQADDLLRAHDQAKMDVAEARAALLRAGQPANPSDSLVGSLGGLRRGMAAAKAEGPDSALSAAAKARRGVPETVSPKLAEVRAAEGGPIDVQRAGTGESTDVLRAGARREPLAAPPTDIAPGELGAKTAESERRITPGLVDEELGRVIPEEVPPTVLPQPTDAPRPRSAWGREQDAAVKIADETEAWDLWAKRPENSANSLQAQLATLEAAQQQPGILLRAETPVAAGKPAVLSGTFVGQQAGTATGFVRIGNRNVSVPMDALPAGVKKGTLVEVASEALNAESVQGASLADKFKAAHDEITQRMASLPESPKAAAKRTGEEELARQVEEAKRYITRGKEAAAAPLARADSATRRATNYDKSLFGELEDQWRGGVANKGNSQAGILAQLAPGHQAYQAEVAAEVRKQYGDSFTAWRSMTPNEYERWIVGDMQEAVGFTTNRKMADKWQNIAGSKSKRVVVETTLTPEMAVLRGSAEESEVVIDSSRVSANTIKKAGAENSPSLARADSATKVADQQGRPVKVYHGTHYDFTDFKVGKGGEIWFAEDPQKASNYTVEGLAGGRVRTAHLNIANPLVYGSPEARQAVKEGWFGNVKEMRARGYDGTQKGSPGSRIWTVFSPDQVLLGGGADQSLARADSATRRAIDRGETSVALAKSDPAAAAAEAIVNQRTRVLALTSDTDLQTYLRGVTDQPISPAAAREWAHSGTGDLDSWARRSGPANNMLGALALGPASLGGDDDEPNRLKKILVGTVPLMLVAAVLSRGKLPKTLFREEATAARSLKAAETRYAAALRFLERAPSNPAFARNVEQAAKTLAAAKATREGAQIAGADLAAMVGKPGVPLELVHRMDDAAQIQHLIARRNAADSVNALTGFLEKYEPIIRRHGSEFNNSLLDGLALQAATLGVNTDRMGALVKRVVEHRTKVASSTTAAAVAQLQDQFTGTLGPAGNVMLGSDAAGALDPQTWGAVFTMLDKAGTINHQGGEMPMALRAWFMEARNVAAFNPKLHAVMTYASLRELIEKRLMFEHAQLGESIFHGLSDGQLAAIPYIMQNKPVPKTVPFGQRTIRVRPLAEVAKERGGNEILKAGEELYDPALHGHSSPKVVVFNPNKHVATVDDAASRNAAKQWREQILDPLYIMAGGDPNFLKQHYFSRIYAQGTLSDFAKAGVVSPENAEKLLAERLVQPDDIPMPANKMAMRALMMRQLGDTEAYLSDPRLINRLYVTQASRKIAYDPVVAKMKEILTQDFPEGVTKEADRVNKYFNRFLLDLEGRHESYLDQSVEGINKALTKLGIPDKMDASPFARFSAVSSLADFIREPGYKPGARLAHVVMGLEYSRKMGFNPKSLIMNIPQHIIGTAAQGGRHVLADYAAAAVGPQREALMQAFTMSGMVNETTKFVGTRGVAERMLLGDIDSATHPLRAAMHKIYEWGPAPFAKTEEWNNFMSFALVHADAERGTVFREGVGWTQGAPLSSVEANVAGFFSGSRRSNFGGRITRPQAMRNEGFAMMFQFQNYVWRMTGKIGNEFKLSIPAAARAKEAWGKRNAALAAGNMEAASRWGSEAGLEFWRNVMAPYRTLAGLGAFAGLLSAAGVEPFNSFGNVLGFVPGLDQERLFQDGQIRLTDSASLGPAVGDLGRAIDVIANVTKTYSNDPNKARLGPLRLAELGAWFLPTGEVMVRHAAKAVFDPRLNDEARIYMLMGFKAGKVKTPADIARLHAKALRQSVLPPVKPRLR